MAHWYDGLLRTMRATGVRWLYQARKVRRRFGLTMSDMAVWGLLRGAYRVGKVLTMPYEVWGALCGISRRQVLRSLRRLESLGMVARRASYETGDFFLPTAQGLRRYKRRQIETRVWLKRRGAIGAGAWGCASAKNPHRATSTPSIRSPQPSIKRPSRAPTGSLDHTLDDILAGAWDAWNRAKDPKTPASRRGRFPAQE